MSLARWFAALCLALVVPTLAPAADRLTDEQVKKLIDDIDAGYDAWKHGLEKRNLDDAVITSAERSIDVKSFLQDFEKEIDLVKDRFQPNSAATNEVLALLRRGGDVELRNRRQGLTPSSEWTALGSKLGALAAAYRVAWPVESMNVQAARLNDGELATRVEQMEKSVKQLLKDTEKAAKADKSIDTPTRESLEVSIEELESTTKDVRSRLKDDRPASTEVAQLLSQTAKVKAMLTTHSLSSAGGAAWQGIDSATVTLALAYDLPKQ
jgi:hypothetical protein